MTVLTIKRALFTLLLSFSLLSAAHAAEVKKSLSIAEVEAIIAIYSDGDYKDLDDGDYSFNMDGTKVVIFRKSSGKSLQLYAGFNTDSSIKDMNTWNKDKRFSRAYIDDENDPVLESDLDLEGGVTLGAVNEFIDTFKLSVKAFRKHIDF